MPKRKALVNIFDYSDYRRYLHDYYRSMKRSHPAFSYRYFARKAGISSVGYYRDVVSGRQSLGRAMIMKFSNALKHTGPERAYFENMVYFNDTKTIDGRKMYFERMVACSESKTVKIDSDRYEYYSQWYYGAVRELLQYYPFSGNFKEMAGRLNPPITTRQARKAVRILERLRFIKRNRSGRYVLSEPLISTGMLSTEDRVKTVHVLTFQKEMMRLAGIAYDRHPPRKIDMSTLTLSISDPTYAIIKKEIAALRGKILSLAGRDSMPDRVYQLNYQFFPLTNLPENNGNGR